MDTAKKILNEYAFDISAGHGNPCIVVKYDGALEAMQRYTADKDGEITRLRSKLQTLEAMDDKLKHDAAKREATARNNQRLKDMEGMSGL